MITVMGATGNTGRKIAAALLDAGQQVRALGRAERKLAELGRAGAEVLTGDAGDAAFLARASLTAAATARRFCRPIAGRQTTSPGSGRRGRLSRRPSGRAASATSWP